MRPPPYLRDVGYRCPAAYREHGRSAARLDAVLAEMRAAPAARLQRLEHLAVGWRLVIACAGGLA